MCGGCGMDVFKLNWTEGGVQVGSGGGFYQLAG